MPTSLLEPLTISPRDSLEANRLGNRVLVLAPFGRDSDEICETLRRGDIEAEPCGHVDLLLREIRRGAGVALLSDDVLRPGALRELSDVLNEQPTWSDFPLLVLTSPARSGSQHHLRATGIDGASYLNLLERPLHAATLLSAVRTALQARRRQYEVRDELVARKQAEETLREREATLSAVLDALPVGVVIADATGRVTRFNQATRELWGMPPETDSWEGYGEWMAWWPETGERITADEWAMTRALLRGETTRGELIQNQVFGTSERRFYLNNVAPILGEGGKVIGGVGAMLDVTDQIEAERALRESEIRFRSLANAMPQLVWSARPDGTVDYYNERVDLYDGIRGDGSGWEWAPALHPDDHGRTSEAWRHAVASGEVYEIEHRVRLIDGAFHWHLSRAVPIRDDDGKIVRWYGTATDIHEQIELREALLHSERELQQINQELERRVAERTAELASKNEELQQFAYVASHDFQEPLRKIQTFANLLETEHMDVLDNEARFYLSRIENAAERMSHLLADMLDFSRVATRMRPKTLIRVSDVVRQAMSDLEMNIREVGARIEVDADVLIEADENQLRQVINHLLLNALKFRWPEAAPHIQITAKLWPSSADESAESQVCRITVQDNGIGFNPRYAERIFKPFERLQGRSEYPGTGMGLAICRRIVQRHAGRIWAESEPGAGSRFLIELPTPE